MAGQREPLILDEMQYVPELPHHLKFEEVYGPAALYRGAVVCRTDQPYPLTERGRIAALPLGGTQGLCQWIAEQVVA